MYWLLHFCIGSTSNKLSQCVVVNAGAVGSRELVVLQDSVSIHSVELLLAVLSVLKDINCISLHYFVAVKCHLFVYVLARSQRGQFCWSIPGVWTRFRIRPFAHLILTGLLIGFDQVLPEGICILLYSVAVWIVEYWVRALHLLSVVFVDGEVV